MEEEEGLDNLEVLTSTVDICRDFLRNVCYRDVRCKYRHLTSEELLAAVDTKLDPSSSTVIYEFCHDFQNQGCDRPNCKFIHCSAVTEQRFSEEGILPLRLKYEFELGVQELYVAPLNAKMASTGENVQEKTKPVCRDYIQRQCRRGKKCRFAHVEQQKDDLGAILTQKRKKQHAHVCNENGEKRLRLIQEDHNQNKFNYSPQSDAIHHIKEENTLLRKEVANLRKQVSGLLATNEVLLEQNAQFRLQKRCMVEGGTPFSQGGTQSSIVSVPIAMSLSYPRQTQQLTHNPGLAGATLITSEPLPAADSAPQTMSVRTHAAVPHIQFPQNTATIMNSNQLVDDLQSLTNHQATVAPNQGLCASVPVLPQASLTGPTFSINQNTIPISQNMICSIPAMTTNSGSAAILQNTRLVNGTLTGQAGMTSMSVATHAAIPAQARIQFPQNTATIVNSNQFVDDLQSLTNHQATVAPNQGLCANIPVLSQASLTGPTFSINQNTIPITQNMICSIPAMTTSSGSAAILQNTRLVNCTLTGQAAMTSMSVPTHAAIPAQARIQFSQNTATIMNSNQLVDDLQSLTNHQAAIAPNQGLCGNIPVLPQASLTGPRFSINQNTIPITQNMICSIPAMTTSSGSAAILRNTRLVNGTLTGQTGMTSISVPTHAGAQAHIQFPQNTATIVNSNQLVDDLQAMTNHQATVAPNQGLLANVPVLPHASLTGPTFSINQNTIPITQNMICSIPAMTTSSGSAAILQNTRLVNGTLTGQAGMTLNHSQSAQNMAAVAANGLVVQSGQSITVETNAKSLGYLTQNMRGAEMTHATLITTNQQDPALARPTAGDLSASIAARVIAAHAQPNSEIGTARISIPTMPCVTLSPAIVPVTITTSLPVARMVSSHPLDDSSTGVIATRIVGSCQNPVSTCLANTISLNASHQVISAINCHRMVSSQQQLNAPINFTINPVPPNVAQSPGPGMNT